MKSDLKKIKDLIDNEYYFLKCKAAFQECINSKGNDYLKEELVVPVDEIVIQNEYINLSFKQENKEFFVIDVRIGLFNKEIDKKIGYYNYQEDMNGDYLDEFLVIY